MLILNIIFALYILIIVLIHQIGFLVNIKVNKKQYMFMLFYFGIAYAFLAAQINPPPLWDLVHHYNEIDRMRSGGLDYALTQGRYKELFIINFIYYAVSLFDYNNLLVFITIFIEYMIFTYISCDLKEKYERERNTIAFSINFFLFFALVNIVLSISGIRNVFAFSIASLAVYMDLFKQRKGIIKYLLYILPIFIHPSTIIVPVARIFVLTPKMYKLAPLLIIWGIFASNISELLESSSIGALQTAGYLLKLYGESSTIIDYRVVIVNVIFVSIIIIACLYILKKKHLNYNIGQLQYITFIIIYLFVALGSLQNVLIFNRMLYGLAFLILPLIHLILQSISKKIRTLFVIICIVFFTGMIMYQGLELFHAITYYK
ncbi:EpsG family protein [Lysinibacillus xylanilyticus]|uniref:EpsG family protein n=1 Tax=Lysinibacillus xylanilyticus TaxID=582475 RepID=UPI003829AB37